MWWLSEYGEKCGSEWTPKGACELPVNYHEFRFYFSAHSRVASPGLGVNMAQ